jgi:truncated hemoglobin YjbI
MDAKAKSKAYSAGRALPSVQWPEDATDEQRTPGVHHCPFAVGDPQRDEWLRGLKDALGAPTKDPAKIVKEINDELKVASHAG